ncbi:hypothetical protein BOX15_Mlig017669g2 [Macrostomum lignano]|uniref:RNB domain-containing protein n=1 Tax=Macrostomum lignano TaxID=282301 RepID=A0A267G7Q0_9PLAT|nr:hypothetical protein BOX15_Mlig017669g2 [Macrostomum lignano]
MSNNRRCEQYSSPEELARILKLFDSCQEYDEFDTTVQSSEEKWRSKLNNVAEYRLCRMRFDQGSYPVAIPEAVINNVLRIRLTSRVTSILQDERIVVRITNRQYNSTEAEGVIEGRYCNEEKYAMLSKSRISKIMARKPKNFRVCELQLEGSQQGWAVPVEATDELEKVELKGRTNCGRACQGDTVLVEVLDKDEDNPRLGHGRVVGVLKQHEKLVYKLFICEIIYDDGSFMRPLCHSFPKIGYDNRHARVWYREYYEQNVMRSQPFQSRRATGVQNRDERGMEDVEKYANLHYVSVYNPRKRLVESAEIKRDQQKGKKGKRGLDMASKNAQSKAQFEFSPYGNPLHVQKHNCDKLFVVCYLGWNVNQFYPTGKVVHVFDRVDSLKSTLEVLMLKHSLPRKMLETPAVKRDLERIRTIATDTSDHPKRRDFRSHFTITIDNPDTKDMDDAISFQYNQQTRVALVGVHITDVSYYIEKDSHLDKLGRNRVVTIYPPRIAKQAGVTPNHLFPSDLSESLLSLVEGKDRRCLSTIFEFKQDLTGEWDLRRRTPAMTLINSNHRLNKDAVHDILLGKEADFDVPPSQELIAAIRYLWSIAKELRIHRMGSAAFVLRDQLEDAQSAIGDKFEASALVEEFMVLANRTVGEFLASSKYLEPFVNRVQQSPRDVDVDLWRSKFEFSVVQSAELSRHFRNLSAIYDEARVPRQNIRIFKDDSRLLQQLCSQDPRSALLMLYSETRFPYLFLAISDWHKISQPARYIEFQAQQPKLPSLHYDLNIENYVHFTSPLRRYPDILAHRALRAQLEAQIQGKVESIEDLAEYMNCVMQRSKRFEKDGQCFEFAELNKTKPQCLLSVVREMSEDELLFTGSSLEFLPALSKTIPLRFLSLIDKPVLSNGCMRLQWKKKIFCHPSSERWNSFIEHGIKPERNSECVVSSTQYFDFVDFNCAKSLKEQLLNSQGNYDRVRQHCESSADRIVEIPDELVARSFFVSSESAQQENSIMNSSSHVSKEVRLGDIMKVQFYNVMSSGLLTPTIQMVELCDTIDMCTAHRMRPVASFERIADEASSNSYRDTLHYANVWLPIVSMESATVAAAADDSFVVHDAELLWRWDDKNKRHLGLFCLTEQYCQNRLIRFSDSVYHDPRRKEKLEEHAVSKSDIDPTDEAFRIAESIEGLRYAEYICLRSKRDSHTWIGHGGIVSVYISPHTKSVLCGAPKVHICRFVVFHLNEVSCDASAPQESLSRASIEVIYKFLPSRRQEIALQKLVDVEKFDLASRLINLECERRRLDATGDWTIYLNHLRNLGVQQYVIRLPAENNLKHFESIPCNDSQEKAISKAMTQPVTLIWGPPGTGKTSTGIMLTYWYVFINRCIDDTWHEADDYYDAMDDDQEDEEAVEDEDAADADVRIRYEEMGIEAQPKEARQPKQPVKVKVVAKGRDKSKKLQTRRQVLYCGPSNASVDVVATYLQNRLRLKCPRIVRVASEQIEQRRYPVPGEGSKSKVNAETEISAELEPVTLHEVVRTGNGKSARLLKSFDKIFRSFLQRRVKSASAFRNVLVQMLPSLPDLDKYLRAHLREYALLTDPTRNEPLQPCDMDLSTITQLYRVALSDAKSIALQRFEVVLCTTSVSSSGLLQKSCRFCQIIIDEAGMCTQPETLVPVVGYLRAAPAGSVDDSGAEMPARLGSHYAERLVLIGDHKQLCPIIQNKTAALLGLRKSFLEYQSDNMIMLRYQYRMHPSLADFPAEYFYNVSGQDGQPNGPGLQTRRSPSWTGLKPYGNIRKDAGRYWNGVNTHLLAEDSAYERMLATNANVLYGCWPGVRTRQRCVEQGFVYSTMPDAHVGDLHPMGEEERVVFLHIAGKEKRTTVASDEGHEDSRCNEREAETAVRIYKSIVQRLSSRRFVEGSIGVLSQYRYQVSVIKQKLQQEGFTNPAVQTVIASQGSEFDYVILSLVRSLPEYEIPKCPLPGWENKYLGFITDENQINVALTRARRGLIIIGNRSLLRTNRMWSCLLDRLDRSGCIPAHPDDFPDRTGDRRRLNRSGLPDDSSLRFAWRPDLRCFLPQRRARQSGWDWQPGPPERRQQPQAAGATAGFHRPFSVRDEEFPELR